MAATTRVPFAPLGDARLHRLTSIKNCQNGLTNPPSAASSGKRKASTFELDLDFDSENVDPLTLFTKKSKTQTVPLKPRLHGRSMSRPLSTRKIVTPAPPGPAALPPSTSTTTHDISIATSTTVKTTAAGRSPVRKAAALSYTRVAPPPLVGPASDNLGFSIASALSATTPSVSAPRLAAAKKHVRRHQPATFTIYEDTPEDYATNMMEHSAGLMDISSDEEDSSKAQEKKWGGKGKENIPPPADNVVASWTELPVPTTTITTASETAASITTSSTVSSITRRHLQKIEGAIEIDRAALSEMPVADFWPEELKGKEGKDLEILVAGDDDEEDFLEEEQDVAEADAGKTEQSVTEQHKPVVPLDVEANASTSEETIAKVEMAKE